MRNFLKLSVCAAGLLAFGAMDTRAEAPALQLGVSGKILTYGIYTDLDHGHGQRKFDFRKDSEIGLEGEVALDNGVAAGVSFLMNTDRADGAKFVKESYVYLTSPWGKVIFGEEDGAAYLLQVTAPSADSNIDGVRPVIGTLGAAAYAQADFNRMNKFTYFTPVFSGVQMGVSYTPTIQDINGLAPAQATNNLGELDNGWEIAARYQNNFEGVGVILGGAYSRASQEVGTALNDALKTWNLGAKLGFDAWDVGAAYLHTNRALSGDNDRRIWVVGVNYRVDEMVYGLSYQNRKTEADQARDDKAQRWTAGSIYNWGPGLSFRASVQYVDVKQAHGGDDNYAVNIGTQINF